MSEEREISEKSNVLIGVLVLALASTTAYFLFTIFQYITRSVSLSYSTFKLMVQFSMIMILFLVIIAIVKKYMTSD